MRKRMTLATVLWLRASISLAAVLKDEPALRQEPSGSKAAEKETPDGDASAGEARARKRRPGQRSRKRKASEAGRRRKRSTATLG